MSMYRECEFCGASLDPGEHCDCQEETALKAHPVRATPQERRKAAVIATGNKWAKENFALTH